MAVKSRNTLKTYFETGDKPTQNEFEDLIDTMVTPEDAISNIEIDALE